MAGAGRPYVTLPEKLRVDITFGNELMYSDTLEEYFGEYHVYPNNAIYSDGEYNERTSKELLPLIRPLQSPQCKRYLQLSKILFSQHTAPTNYYVTVAPEDYQVGSITRFFIQKINEPHRIFEVNSDQFKSVNTVNQPGPNGRLYRRDRITWTITGNINIVREKNIAATRILDHTLPGIGTYILTDPTEFSKIQYTGPQTNLFTSGGIYTTSNLLNYVGSYHIRIDGNAYQGPVQVSGDNRQIFPVK